MGVFVGSCDAQSKDMKYPVILMESVQKIMYGFESLLTDKEKKKLAGYMQKLGFDDISTMFCDLTPKAGKMVNHLFVLAVINYFVISFPEKRPALPFRFSVFFSTRVQSVGIIDLNFLS